MTCSSKYILYQNNQTIKKREAWLPENDPTYIVYQKAHWSYTRNSKITFNFQLNQPVASLNLTEIGGSRVVLYEEMI